MNRRTLAVALLAPAVALLLAGSLAPLLATLGYSTQAYNLLDPAGRGFAGVRNYNFLLQDPVFWASLRNTLVLVGSVLVVTVGAGVPLAVLFNQNFPGRSIARLLVIAPFFVMPAAAALIWKNLLMHPVYGLLAHGAQALGQTPFDWFATAPMAAVVVIVSWQWLPFALLILLTALQSLDQDQVDAAKIDGAGPLSRFLHIVLPHLGRPIAVVVMMETIFVLALFAEIFVTTAGGPGSATTTLAYLIYQKALLQFDIGAASAGGVLAIILANLVAAFMARLVARRLEA